MGTHNVAPSTVECHSAVAGSVRTRQDRATVSNTGQVKGGRDKKPCIVRFHLCEMFRTSKSLEGRLAVARRWVQRILPVTITWYGFLKIQNKNILELGSESGCTF